jgi:hypothetical protein
LILAIALALVAALAGVAVAGPSADSAVSKKKTKKIAKQQVNKLTPGIIEDEAPDLTVGNAEQLGGQDPSAYETDAASTSATTNLTLTTANQTVLTTSITIPSTKTVTAVASIEGSGDGGGNDNVNCNLNIAGVDGVRQSTNLPPGASTGATMPLVQSSELAAGTHTVLVECSEGGASNGTLHERALSIVSTG